MDKKDNQDWQKRKKVNFAIKKDLQIWLFVRIMRASLLAIIFAGILSYLYAQNAFEADFLRFQAHTRSVGEIFLPIFLAAALTSIVAGLLAVLFITQKVVGPLYRVEQDLKQTGSGDLSKIIQLRPSDILKEHAGAVNMAIEDIGKMITEAKESAGSLEEKIMEGNPEEIKKALESHKNNLDQLITAKR